jgi:2-amino-4-hydroxy-6-hydroxymethyldihydropteridine diphosphokinase
MFPMINVGPVAIQAVGFILLISFFIGTWLTGKMAENLGTNAQSIENSIFYGLLTGILSARIGFMLINPSVFINNPLSLLSLTPSMLDTSFGILVGILTAIILAQKKHLPLWPTLDTLTPLILLIFLGVHLANYANGNAYGRPTELPWGIQLWNAVRHPVQLYAVLLGTVLLCGLLIKTRWLKSTGFRQSGVLFNLVLADIAMITLFTRAFSAEKILLGSLDFYQLLAFFVLIGSLGLLYRRVFPKHTKKSVIISMGSNIDPKQQISRAEELLAGEYRIRRKSSLYQTEDVNGHPETRTFLNRVIEIESELPFPSLVKHLKAIEKDLGREPGNKIQVALDLDVLTYGDEVFVEGRHRIPDPNMLKYRYIAMPLAEMSPDFRHPANGLSIQEILEKMDDDTLIRQINEVENGIKR